MTSGMPSYSVRKCDNFGFFKKDDTSPTLIFLPCTGSVYYDVSHGHKHFGVYTRGKAARMAQGLFPCKHIMYRSHAATVAKYIAKSSLFPRYIMYNVRLIRHHTVCGTDTNTRIKHLAKTQQIFFSLFIRMRVHSACYPQTKTKT